MLKIPEKEGASAIEGRPPQNTVPASPYSGIDRKISEEDLQSPAVQRILLGEVDKLESKVSQLDYYVEQFHIKDKEVVRLEEKLKAAKSGEVLATFTLTVGSAAVGLSFSLTNGKIEALFLGLALWIGTILAKVIKWH